MPIEMRTQGYNWKQVLREQDIFCALVTPAWHQDTLAQRQYAYARQCRMPIVLLIQMGTALPPGADDYIWRVWETMDELTTLLVQVEQGVLR